MTAPSARVCALLASTCIVIAPLTGCSDSYDDQLSRLERQVKANKIGSSRDYWLIKRNVFGSYDKVGLIFGFVSDSEFCEEVADLYVKKYPGSKYQCFPAN